MAWRWPCAADEAPARPPSAELSRLKSGLSLVVHATPGLGTAAVCSLFPAGLARDGAGGEVARAVAETVREGGRRARGSEYSRVLEGRGGRSSVFLGNSRVEFCTEVPRHELSVALWLESGRHGAYAFTRENFEHRLRELSLGRHDDFPGHVAERTFSLAFPELVLSGPATASTAATAGEASDSPSLLERARRFHAEHYRLERAVLAVAGDVEPAEVRAQVEQLFAAVPAAAPLPDEPASRQTSPRYMAIEEPALTAALHTRAWVVPGPASADYAALELAAELLAGSADSILAERLLEPGIARGVEHTLEPHGADSLLSVTVELASSQSGADVVALVDQAVRELAAGALPKDRLERARRRLSLRQAFAVESALGAARWLGRRASLGVGLSAEALDGARAAVTAPDVRRVVLEHLPETRRVVVELLPKEAREAFRVATPRFHIVTEGEALSRIARREGTTVSELIKLNDLDSKDRIRPGQKLKLPPAKPKRVHVVKKGETLIGIAKKQGVTVEALRRANGLKKGGVLRAGAELVIPPKDRKK